MQKTFLVLILSFISWISVFGAQDSVKLTLTLSEAERYAIEHNRVIQNADYEVRNAEKSKWQALASMLPQISATLDYQNLCGYEIEFAQGISIPMNPSGTIGVTAAVAFSGAQLVGNNIAKIAVQMSDLSAKQTEQDIVAAVDKLYFSILAMEETVDLLSKSLVNLQQLETMTQNAVDVGTSEQTDADKLSIQVATMESSINSTERSLEMLYNSLRLQLGCDVNAEIELVNTLEELINTGQMQHLLQEEFDIEKNYSYQLLEKNLEMSEKQITLSKMECVPTVSVFYQYSAKSYFGKDAGMNMTPPNMVGASISVPIWSSLTRNSKIEQSKINHQINQNTFYDTRDALLVQDKQLRYNLTSAYENYLIQEKNIDVTQRVFDNISQKYEYGRASSLEVTTASSEIINAQNTYISSLIQLVEAHIDLKNLLNTNNQ